MGTDPSRWKLGCNVDSETNFRKANVARSNLRRPVSVHCVNSYGIFVSAINELLERTIIEEDIAALNSKNSHCISDDSCRFLLPPAVAMHSFTGTAHHVNELLDIEHRIDFPNDNRTERKKKKSPKNLKTKQTDDTAPPPSLRRPPLIYFGFSYAVNYAMCCSDKSRRRGEDAVQEAVPLARLLVESDVHSDVDVAGGTVGAISYLAWARNMRARDVMSVTSKNGLTFFGSIRS